MATGPATSAWKAMGEVETGAYSGASPNAEETQHLGQVNIGSAGHNPGTAQTATTRRPAQLVIRRGRGFSDRRRSVGSTLSPTRAAAGVIPSPTLHASTSMAYSGQETRGLVSLPAGSTAPASNVSTAEARVYAGLNVSTEHWLVTGKDAARRTDSPPDVGDAGHMLSLVVTFEPGTYIVVAHAQVGSNEWFKHQRCLCKTYQDGFHRVKRPATIRDHLAKQPCAPSALAALAETQLRLMRSGLRKHSLTASTSTSPSPSIPPMSPYFTGFAPSSLPATLGSSAGSSASSSGDFRPFYSTPIHTSAPFAFLSTPEIPSSVQQQQQDQEQYPQQASTSQSQHRTSPHYSPPQQHSAHQSPPHGRPAWMEVRTWATSSQTGQASSLPNLPENFAYSHLMETRPSINPAAATAIVMHHPQSPASLGHARFEQYPHVWQGYAPFAPGNSQAEIRAGTPEPGHGASSRPQDELPSSPPMFPMDDL